MRLVGDIGGTNARFALVEEGDDLPREEETLACADYPDLGVAAEAYLAARGTRVRDAAFAVATPVTGDEIQLTNSASRLSVRETRARLGLDRLLLLNDFTALALALPLLRPNELRQVGGGQVRAGRPKALLGAGTGLGVSGLVPSGAGWIPLEGEGGHTAFSPANDREAAVLGALWKRFDHVSTERVASGPGLALLHEMLGLIDGQAAEALSPEEITRRAEDGDVRCHEALEMFCGILGTAAANLCVTLGAMGGVYIGGGVVPRLGDRFDRSCFRARFEAKGRFRTYVAEVPTFVITAVNPALRGVARAFDRPVS